MSIRIRKSLPTTDNLHLQGGLKNLQQTINLDQSASCSEYCRCRLCQTHEIKIIRKSNQFQDSSYNSDKWLFQILNGLNISGTRTLKLYIPDISFIDGDLLHIFYTQSKDNRVSKISGTTPIKSLYTMMVKLRKQYKGMLQQNFHRIMIDEVDPEYMHEKYLDQLLPTHFHDGENSKILSGNKNSFRRYVLHKNEKYTINSIEEHKLNENQPFCTVRYKDANSQLFSKHEFETFTLTRIPNDIVFVQSYIKEKQQAKAIYTSSYTELSKDIDLSLFQKAELYVLILIDGIGKYSPQYQQIQVLEDITFELMKENIQKYCQYMTYQIVHYLAMVSRIFIKHIKLNWILNDMGFVYFQNIIEYEKTQISFRPLRYQLPPKQDNMVFYKDANNFLTLYKQMKVMRDFKKKNIKKQLQRQKDKQRNQTTISELNEEKQRKISINTIRMPKLNSLKNQELSKTIDLSTMTARNTIDERHRNKNILSKKKSRYENYSSLEKPKQSPLKSFRNNLKFEKNENKKFAFLHQYDF